MESERSERQAERIEFWSNRIALKAEEIERLRQTKGTRKRAIEYAQAELALFERMLAECERS